MGVDGGCGCVVWGEGKVCLIGVDQWVGGDNQMHCAQHKLKHKTPLQNNNKKTNKTADDDLSLTPYGAGGVMGALGSGVGAVGQGVGMIGSGAMCVKKKKPTDRPAD